MAITSIEEIFVDPALRHSLPSDRISSRLSHAKIWELFGLKRDTVKTLVLLSRHSRAFILTQGLNGFLLECHDCSASWFFDFCFSPTMRNRIVNDIPEPEQVSEVLPLLAELSTADEKEAFLKRCHPTVYVYFLRSTGRTDEVDALWSYDITEYRQGEVTKENMRWYIYIELLPRLAKMRKEKKIKHTEKVMIEWRWGMGEYTGDIDMQNRPCGWGEVKATEEDGVYSLRGTWLDGQPEGIMVFSEP